MTIFERAALMREAESWGRKLWLLWATYGSSVSLFLFFAIFANPNAVITQSVLAGTCIMLMMIVLPVCILLSRDWVRRSRGFRRSAASGSISRYEGEVPAEALIDPTFAELKKIEILHSLKQCTIEVLSGSRMVWKINAERVAAWVIAPEIEVASVPAFAAVAANWLEPVETDSIVLAGHRDLSTGEKDELRGHARRAWLKNLPFALGLTVWASLPVSGMILTGLHGNFFGWLRAIVLVMSALGADFALVQGVIHSRRLNADRRLGTAGILRIGAEQDDLTADSEDAAGEELWMEILPVSGCVWTEAGMPAVWRKVQL